MDARRQRAGDRAGAPCPAAGEVGPIAIDLAFTVVFVAVIVLRAVVLSL
jgi:hypothetical protein